MSPAEFDSLARRQLADYDSRSPGMMFAERGIELSLKEAYQLQIETVRLRKARGEKVAGYKIGCVSETIRRQLGVEHPVFGHVFEGEFRQSGVELPEGEFDQLGIEGEFAVTLARDVSAPDDLREDPRRFAGEVFPVIELHNFAFRRADPSAVELIANNAVHAGNVVSKSRSAAKEIAELEISVAINGEELGRATVDPFATMHELAQRLWAFDIPLHAGDILLTGSPLPLYRVAARDEIRVSCPAIAEVTACVAGSARTDHDSCGS